MDDGVSSATFADAECIATFVELDRRAGTPRAAIKAVIAAVATLHGVTYQELMARTKFVPWVRARNDAIAAVALRFPHLSYPQLGRIFGKDHTTIMHSLKRAGIPLRGRSYHKNLALKQGTPDGEKETSTNELLQTINA